MKRLEIQWRHLDKDGRTCDRCADTGEEVRSAHAQLAAVLAPAGWTVELTETLLSAADIAHSNRVSLNGIAIEEILPGALRAESRCASCTEILGAPTSCRTVAYNGAQYETIPAALIREAAYRLIGRE